MNETEDESYKNVVLGEENDRDMEVRDFKKGLEKALVANDARLVIPYEVL